MTLQSKGASTMTDDSMNTFDPEHLKRWWETTRCYLFADRESLPGAAAETEDGWSPPQTDSRGGRKRFIARVRGWLLRSVRCGEQGDSLRELERAFQQQIAFITRHPDVPRRLLSWLAQDDDRGLQQRVRMLIANYVSRLARIIARAKQQGLVRADVQPSAAAISLVGVIQELVLGIPAAPQWREWFLREAAEVFALYRAGLAVSSD
jgi:TetR/AcrR family transcriptional regulator